MFGLETDWDLHDFFASQLAELDDAKTAFFSNASHELRESTIPLTGSLLTQALHTSIRDAPHAHTGPYQRQPRRRRRKKSQRELEISSSERAAAFPTRRLVNGFQQDCGESIGRWVVAVQVATWSSEVC